MATTRKIHIENEKQKLTIVTISTAILIVMLAAYALAATPEVFQPDEVEVTGTVTAPGIMLNRIAFTNTGCGTRTEAQISPSGTYDVVLGNQYTYNVTVIYTDSEGATAEKAAGTLALNTGEKTLTRDWVIKT